MNPYILEADDMVPALTMTSEDEAIRISNWVEKHDVKVVIRGKRLRGTPKRSMFIVRSSAKGFVSWAVAPSPSEALLRSFSVLQQQGVQ